MFASPGDISVACSRDTGRWCSVRRPVHGIHRLRTMELFRIREPGTKPAFCKAAEETIEKFRISAKSLGCFNGDANLLHAPERDFHSFYREFDSPGREQILELRRCLAK